MISFHRDKAHVRVNDHFLQQGVNFLKEYCLLANEEYAAQVKREHLEEMEKRRSDLRRRIVEQENKARILQKINI